MQEQFKEQFVPYELALKLKELGFKDKGLGFSYMRFKCKGVENAYVEQVVPNYLYNGWDLLCIAPLWQQAFDWLLKKHNLYGVIIPTITMYWTFKTMTVVEDIVEVPPYNHVDGNDYSTIEEARQACLEKLIELVEN